MLKQKTIKVEELRKFGSVQNLNEQAKALVAQQKATWETAAKNYNGLNKVQNREFNFGHFKIIAQFNPERIRSSAAKTDAKSISERPCFLCLKNLPEVQKGISFQNNYLVLTNPFPIFPTHLTIPHLKHTPQRIPDFFGDMLQVSRELKDFTVFYNGPQTGASAPDHFHFQAGNKGLLPIEKEYPALVNSHSEILLQNKDLTVFSVKNYLRKFIAVQSANKAAIENIFSLIFKVLPAKSGEEPLLNILCNFENREWQVIIFPRKKQRPSHFYRDDGEQIIVSPASVELGGVLILPRFEDFDKITKKTVEEIYSEVTIREDVYLHLLQ